GSVLSRKLRSPQSNVPEFVCHDMSPLRSIGKTVALFYHFVSPLERRRLARLGGRADFQSAQAPKGRKTRSHDFLITEERESMHQEPAWPPALQNLGVKKGRILVSVD